MTAMCCICHGGRKRPTKILSLNFGGAHVNTPSSRGRNAESYPRHLNMRSCISKRNCPLQVIFCGFPHVFQFPGLLFYIDLLMCHHTTDAHMVGVNPRSQPPTGRNPPPNFQTRKENRSYLPSACRKCSAAARSSKRQAAIHSFRFKARYINRDRVRRGLNPSPRLYVRTPGRDTRLSTKKGTPICTKRIVRAMECASEKKMNRTNIPPRA